jgi:hypothetical protein
VSGQIDVVTYFSQNAEPRICWIAYPILNGEVWYVRFTGATEEEAAARARALLQKELDKHHKKGKS